MLATTGGPSMALREHETTLPCIVFIIFIYGLHSSLSLPVAAPKLVHISAEDSLHSAVFYLPQCSVYSRARDASACVAELTLDGSPLCRWY